MDRTDCQRRMRPVALHPFLLPPATMSIVPRLDHTTLAAHASRSQAVTETCACTATEQADGWQSQPLSLPEAQLREIGTLIEAHDEEATFSEYHPGGTRYWSPDAPIAPRYFPYNRCTIWECTVCTRCFLRYTEGGGYFVDRRIRALNASLLEFTMR